MTDDTVKWRVIEGFDGHYEISTAGQIKSLERKCLCRDGRQRTVRERILKHSRRYDQRWTGRGRGPVVSVTVRLSMPGNDRVMPVGHLMLSTWVRKPHHNEVAHYIDRNCQNCALTNLEWIDRSELAKKLGYRVGLRSPAHS